MFLPFFFSHIKTVETKSVYNDVAGKQECLDEDSSHYAANQTLRKILETLSRLAGTTRVVFVYDDKYASIGLYDFCFVRVFSSISADPYVDLSLRFHLAGKSNV